MNKFAFDPEDGLRNKTIYPVNPATEDEAREQIQGRLDEIKDYLNNTLTEDAIRARGVPWRISEWYGNTRLIDDFQDITGFTGEGTISADAINFKIGKQALKILENDNTAGYLSASRTETVDLTKFYNGEVVTDADYIYVPIYISDVTKIDTRPGYGVRLAFVTNTGTDYYNIHITSGLVTGFQFLKLKRSDFSKVGNPDWSNITVRTYGWYSTDNAQNAYVSFQFVQLIKKDPVEAKPNPCQRGGVRDVDTRVAEIYVGKESGNLVYKVMYTGANAFLALLNGSSIYSDFVVDGHFISTYTGYAGGLQFYVDSNNYIYFASYGSGVRVRKAIGGVPTTEDFSENIAAAVGESVYYKMEKVGPKITLTYVKNNDFDNPYIKTVDFNVSTPGKIETFTANSLSTYIESIGITTTEYAAESGHATVASALAIKYKAGAFTAKELNFGEVGIDTTNSRLYVKFNATTVKYATLT